MRNIFPLAVIFMAILFGNCTMQSSDKNEKLVETPTEVHKDSFQLLCQYWKLSDADHPTSRDISFTNQQGILLESGIVFLADSALLENPAGEMSYGKFKIKGNKISAYFDKGRKAIYTIKRLHKDELVLTRIENKRSSELTYKATDTWWPDSDKNPFAIENYAWSKRPDKPESDEQIKIRLKDFIRFYKYYFDGLVNGGATNLDIIGLPCCLNWYQGGITIQSENKLDKKWMNCFYSAEQAFKGRQMLEDILVKKYNWDAKETNWFKQTAGVLQQIENNL